MLRRMGAIVCSALRPHMAACWIGSDTGCMRKHYELQVALGDLLAGEAELQKALGDAVTCGSIGACPD